MTPLPGPGGAGLRRESRRPDRREKHLRRLLARQAAALRAAIARAEAAHRQAGIESCTLDRLAGNGLIEDLQAMRRTDRLRKAELRRVEEALRRLKGDG